MKKLIVAFLSFGLLTCVYGADISRYKQVQTMESASVTQPAIAEVVGLNVSTVYIVTNDKGESVPQQFMTSTTVRVIQPESVQACTTSCVKAPQIADVDERTTFDFPLYESGVQKGSIKIVYAKPISTDRIDFLTTGDSYLPNVFTLVIDGKRVLNTMSGRSARFPMMQAKSIEIQFEYSLPIRFTEVGVGIVTEETVRSTIRFVYQPGTTYMLYSSSTNGREDSPTPAINLFAQQKEVTVSLGDIKTNPSYTVPTAPVKDSDGDTILDTADNCPTQPNKDQKDGNGNGVGDVCDDYDYDGVPTYMDNCPFVENIDQKDTDRDGLGDACDQEESRFTERHVWIPWLTFSLVFLAVCGMGYEVMRKKREENGSA